MDSFTIRDIEHLTGIKAHTLRVWEQRYGLLAPAREGRQHRNYTADDLKRALRIAQLYHSGVKVSTLATMGEAEIDTQLEELADRDQVSAPVRQLIEATIAFDEHSFRQVLDRARTTLGITNGMVRVIYPFLKRVGLMWMHGKVKPGQEHFASTLIRNFLIHAIEALEKPSKDKAKGHILFFAPEGEQHEIPLLFAQYLFRKKGWRTIYLGTDRPISEVRRLVQAGGIDFIFLHPLTNLTQLDMASYVHELTKELPRQQIIVSGPLAIGLHPENKKVKVLRSEEELLELTGEWH